MDLGPTDLVFIAVSSIIKLNIACIFQEPRDFSQ